MAQITPSFDFSRNLDIEKHRDIITSYEVEKIIETEYKIEPFPD